MDISILSFQLGKSCGQFPSIIMLLFSPSWTLYGQCAFHTDSFLLLLVIPMDTVAYAVSLTYCIIYLFLSQFTTNA